MSNTITNRIFALSPLNIASSLPKAKDKLNVANVFDITSPNLILVEGDDQIKTLASMAFKIGKDRAVKIAALSSDSLLVKGE